MSRWLTGGLGVGLPTAFNLLVPGIAQVVPYMSFHLALPVVAWVSRSLLVSWAAVLVSALAGNVVSTASVGRLTLSPPASGAALAFVLIQAAFTLSIVLLRRRMEEPERLLGQVRGERDRLLSLFAHAPFAVATHRGPELVYDFVSPGVQRLAQRPLLGRPMREVFPDLEGQGLLERIERVYWTGDPHVLS